MDFVRQQLATINERLAGLTATQKLLAGALAVIVVMTMLYWGRTAASSEMTALMPGTLTGTDLTAVTSALTAKGIPFTTNAAGQIMVPASQQAEAMMNISFNNVLGGQAVDNFAAMLANTSPLDSENKFNVQVNHYDEQSLAQIIQAAPGVATARVKVHYPARTGFAPVSPTAFAAITTKSGGSMSKRKLAEGAANAMAVCLGVERSKVGVQVDGVTISVADNDGGLGGDFDSSDLIELKQHWEDVYSSMVRNAYHDITGLIVTVNVDVDNESARKVIDDVNPEHKISMPTDEQSESSKSTETSRPPQEPGAMPNMGTSINSPVAAAPTNVTETTKQTTKSQVDYGKSHTESYKKAGAATPRSANIRVPRGYFVSLWKATKNDDKAAATGAEYDAFVKTSLEDMRTQVRKTVGIDDDTAVTAGIQVEMPAPIDDMMATGGPMLAAADAAGATNLKVLAMGHAKDVAVGVLALASLFMVGRMVKKSTPPAPEPILALDNDATPLAARAAATGGAVAAKVRSAPTVQTIGGAEDVAGDVLETGPVLMGQELDEAVLETSQMVDQVGSFVKDNPDMAAQLLSRWMSRE